VSSRNFLAGSSEFTVPPWGERLNNNRPVKAVRTIVLPGASIDRGVDDFGPGLV